MPRYRITAPDGRVFDVTAPDDATQQDALAYAKSQWSGPVRDKTYPLDIQENIASNANDPGQLGAVVIGAGRTGDKIQAGVQQVGQSANVAVRQALGMNTRPGLDSLRSLEEVQRGNDAAYAPLAKKYPFETGVGEALPAVGIPMGQATAAARVFAPALGFGAIGAAEYGTPQERAMRGGLNFGSGLIGGGVGEIAGKVIAPGASRLTPAQQNALSDASSKIGVKPLPSEMTGNPNLSRVEDFLSRVQGGAGVMQDFRAGNQAKVNQYAAGAMGQDTNAITQPVFADAKKTIGGDLNTLRGQANMPVVQSAFDAVDKATQMLSKGLGKVAGKDEAISLLGEVKDRLYSSKQLSGDEYQAIVSDLKTAARQTDNQTIAAAYKSVIGEMDKLAQGTNKDAWAKANREYAAMKTLMEPGVVNEQAGNVNPVRLGTVMGQDMGEAMKTGAVTGPLADIAAYGKALPPARAGSQTFERGATGNLMDWMLSPAYYLAAKGITSGLGRDYLANGLLGNSAISGAVGKIGSKAALPLALSPAEQALFQMGLLNYAQ